MFVIDGNKTSLKQWETDQRLIITWPNSNIYAHFTMRGDAEALVLLAYAEDGAVYVDIPNILLTRYGVVDVYLYVQTGNICHIESRGSFTIEQRSRPVDYDYSETDMLSNEALDRRVTELEQNRSVGVNVSSACAFLIDEVTDKIYKLCVSSGKLTMEETEATSGNVHGNYIYLVDENTGEDYKLLISDGKLTMEEVM